MGGCLLLGVVLTRLTLASAAAPVHILITIAHDAARDASTLLSVNPNYASSTYGDSRRPRLLAEQIAAEYKLDFEGGWQMPSMDSYCGLLTTTEGDRTRIVEALRADPRVESAQPVYDYLVQGARGGDPYAAMQPQLRWLDRLGDKLDGTGVSIGIVDTRVDLTHPDLVNQIARTRDYVTGYADGDDEATHGTAVAGLIAATRGNDAGIAGLAPGAEVVVYRACWHVNAAASAAKCDSFTIAHALSQAIEDKIAVLSLSLAGPPDPLVARLVQTAIARGMLLVAADPQREGFRMPANLPGVVRVRHAAVSRGETDPLTIERADTEVLSTAPGGGYDFFAGTSMSTALISGALVLLKQRATELGTKELVDAFRELVDDNMAAAR
jgi:major intracellular serine protease